MRKLFFAVVLVAASFAGGVVVNGPGLRWAQTMILSRLGSGGDEDALEVDGETKAGAPSPPEPIPGTPVPPLFADTSAATKGAAKAGASKNQEASAKADSSPASSTPAPSATTASTLVASPVPEPEAPAAPTPISSDSPDSKPIGFSDEPVDSPSSRDPKVSLTKASPAAEHPLPLETPPLSSEAPVAAVAKPDSTPSDKKASEPDSKTLDDSRTVAMSSAGATPNALVGSGDQTSGASAASGWPEIRRRLAAFGVSRYGVEGEPKGRVRFHCVIPLAGHRAVAQQFEAEGSDELQAAELVLRRIALWRATETPRP